MNVMMAKNGKIEDWNGSRFDETASDKLEYGCSSVIRRLTRVSE